MLKKAPATIILILLILLSINPLLSSADTTTSTTIYVDDDNTSGPWDGTQDYPYQFIQDGIDIAEPGDTVFVYDGFYNEQIFIDKTLNLQGESMGDTIIDGTGLGRLCTIEETTNVVISGFTFQNAEPDAEALYLYYSTYCIIEQNRFTQNNDNSIYISGGGHLIFENEIINNTYESNNLWVVSSGNTLENNTIKNNKGSGISIVAKNNMITGNIIEGNQEYGIIFFDYISIKNIIISDNIIQDNYVGIFIPPKPAEQVITRNIISGNTNSGIFSHTRRSTITYNTIEDNFVGLHQGYASESNNISHNTFSSNVVGIKSIETISNKYIENNFIKNTIQASLFNWIPRSGFLDSYRFDTWNHNYWDNWRIDLPKPIFGLYCVVIPFCLFDKNPASEPFDMEA